MYNSLYPFYVEFMCVDVWEGVNICGCVYVYMRVCTCVRVSRYMGHDFYVVQYMYECECG